MNDCAFSSGKTESQVESVKFGEDEKDWVKGTATSKQMSLTDSRGVKVVFTRALLK
ncbi:MAG: hypothetical protein IJS66_04920 [Bacteroidales bacterium]|nr:hypothetical protein [Bacteroidales bacterium]